jgi:hypothetical protein
MLGYGSVIFQFQVDQEFCPDDLLFMVMAMIGEKLHSLQVDLSHILSFRSRSYLIQLNPEAPSSFFQ